MNAYVLDHTALSALGSGNRGMSRIVVGAIDEGWHVAVPALCLTAAEAARPGLADHIGALPGLEVVELGYAAASAVGKLVGNGVDWRLAHAVDTGRPAVDWPDGRPVVTATPDAYAPWKIATIDVS